MKYIFLILAIASIGFAACTENNSGTSNAESTIPSLPFKGVWTRSFELGKDSTQHVFYRIWADSIEYEMQGPLPIKYVIKRDTFLPEENRWVGKLGDMPYVIFFKNISAESVTLFKQKTKSRNEALTMPMPADTVSGHFTSWNVYHRKQ